MRKRWRFSIACLLALLTVGGSLALIRTRGQKSQDVAPAAREGKPNRLIKEKSPYLLQHAHNPVDWYPWGEEAFEKARRENKPVFLSIGYSTCHWCHVMEAESFSDTQVASLMNDAFVSIKVDREERPDIDNVYMNVSVLMTGSGGWPLTIIMTPDKRPFFVATYIPKDGRFGQAGLLDLIPRVKEAWATQHERILQSATQITSALQQKTSNSSGADPDTSTLQAAYQQLKSRFDERYGGFGQSQKFPTPHNFLFLLRYWKRTGDAKALEMVERTLQAMRRGGMYDHVGFGFHRYSTEPTWLVPHFEKMLYDQALLAMAYTEAFQATGKEEYEKTAREIFTYVLRDMTSASGGFYSAEDADSEGEEGKFYLWSEKEIRQALGKEDADLFVKVFGVQSGGNFTEQSTGNKPGTNILYLSKPLRETAADLKLPEQQLRNRLELSRQKLFAVREKRIHPGKDDKILVDWNGLMIAALAKGAQAFNEPKYLEAAMRAADFIQRNVRTSDGRLLHRYRDGQANIKAHAEDYAFLIWGLLELHEATFQINYLRAALDLNNELLKHFWDANRGGFYFSADDGEALLVRSKEIYDGAIPSGNSVAMLNLLRLGRITANTDFEQKAAAIGRAFSGEIKSSPSASTQLMVALDFGIGPSYEVVIAGGSQAEDTRAMLNALRIRFIPNKVVLLKPTDQKEPEITRLAAFTKYQSSRDGKATAYVCLNYNCKLPTTEINKMLDLLAGK
ncbi:MAG: thioredoxin domain-containing protein [Pyrinomonadaceae bacterium]|nr:thioredoxin domain-containing protein [Pyrinomonadaceae bacterium]MBA3714915.1 thioredoxin domain-containing protein [Pyrinomonadaceae bacterium]